MITGHSFFPKITLPTRLSNNNGSLIDNILCKLTESSLETTSGVLLNKIGLCDHQSCFTILDNISTREPTPLYVKVCTQDKDSIEQFNDHLKRDLASCPLTENLNQDPNINYNILHEKIQSAKQSILPEKLVKFNRYTHKKSKWITNSLLKSISARDKLYKKYRKTNPNSPQYPTLKTNLNTFNMIIKRNIRLLKKSYYENLFDKYKGDMKGTWKTINEILSRTKRKSKFPKFFKDGNEIVTGKLEIVNHFNNFFTNIGPKLSRLIDPPANKTFRSYLKNMVNQNFNFKTVDTEAVSKVIDSLAPKSSCGVDGISTKLLKSVKDALLKPVTIIVNQMITTGVFPDKLKIAKVTPIFKKDDETLFTNYRPISILPSLSKIFEKIIFKQLYQYL